MPWVDLQPPLEAVHEVTVTPIATINAIIVKIRFIFLWYLGLRISLMNWKLKGCKLNDHQEIQRSGLGYFKGMNGTNEYGN